MNPGKRKVITFVAGFALFATWVALFNAALFSDNLIHLIALILLIPSLILLVYLFLDPEIFLYVIVFLVPVSVKTDLPGGLSLSFPSELLAMIIFGYFLLNMRQFMLPDQKILSHPILKVLVILLGWLLVSSLLCPSIVISLKRTFITLLFIIVFYVLFLPRFKKTENILKFYLYYALGLLVPIANGMLWHAHYNFKQQASYIMPQPFFAEHAIYGASLAFIIPILFYLSFVPNDYNKRFVNKTLFIILLMISLTAEYLSYSRAAWLSLAIAPFILLIIYWRVRMIFIASGFLTLAVLVILNLDAISGILQKNTSRSNRGDLKEQVQSVSNINTDISNLERINRWKCALRMFEERPFTGFGPGTYQFQYGRFQLKPEMTRISTYKGDKGNAHSEYLNFLSEAGFPGCLIFLYLIYLTLRTAFRIIYNTDNRKIRYLTISIILCLSTLYIHSFFNAFLDNDEIASLFYGSTAAITALDIFHKSAT